MSRDQDHDRIVLRLADYAARRLDPPGRTEVGAHLQACADCAGMAEAYDVLAAASAAGGAHLSSEVIAAFAVATPEAAPGEEQARHLASCASCSTELRLAKQANLAAVGPAASFGGRWLLPVAAAIAIAVLGLTAMRAWQRSASLAGRLASLEKDNAALQTQVADLSRTVAENRAAGEAAAGADGAISYLYLHETVRGAAAPGRLTLRPGQDAVYVALALELPATARRQGEDGRVTLRGEDGGETWTAAVPGPEIDAVLARGDALLLRIPVASVRPGRQEIRMTTALAPPTERVWFRSEFEVNGPAPSR
jgi:hypothetical protein